MRNKGLASWVLGPASCVLGLAVLLTASVGANFSSPDQKAANDPDSPPTVATFSILGYDPETGEVGGAVQSRVFTLTGVLTADADAGVVATQAIVDVSYGPKGIALLKQGMTPDAIIKKIWGDDPEPVPDRGTKQGRQVAVSDV